MNLDAINGAKSQMTEAIQKGDTRAFIDKAFETMSTQIQESVTNYVLEKYEEYKAITDTAVLESRGIHALTSEETKFYETLVSMAKGEAGLTNTTVALPVTTSNRVFDELKVAHPLLQKINFVDSKGLTEWILAEDLDYAGAWGDLNDEIVTGAKAAFTKIEFSQFKLSTWIPVPITMIELGLTWLDQFVVEYLAEIIARKLEDAIINGDGQNKPVGMIKTVNVKSQTRPAVDKETTDYTLTDLSTTTVGKIAAALTNGGKRTVGVIDMIVNPVDYWGKVYPALFYTNQNGQVVKSNVPINVIESCAVASGKAVFGVCENYFATIGFGKNGKIQYSDHFKFLSDVRTYKARCVAYGTPKDDVSFIYADISGLVEAAMPTRAQKK